MWKPGAWGLQPPSGGWSLGVERAAQQLIHLLSLLNILYLSNSIWVLGFGRSGYTYLRDMLENLFILLINMKPMELIITMGGFPGGAVVKNPPANAGDTGSSPDPGRSHMPRSN